jgi:hypothetical protein
MGANPNILLPGFWRSGAHGIPVPVVWPLLRVLLTDSKDSICSRTDTNGHD